MCCQGLVGEFTNNGNTKHTDIQDKQRLVDKKQD